MAKNLSYNIFFDECPDTVIVFDSEWNILDINPVGCDLLKYDRDHVDGLHLRDISGSVELHNDPPKIATFSNGKTVTNERILKTRHGKLLTFEVSSRLTSNDQVLSICRLINESNQQLTNQKSEAKLNEYKLLSQHIFDNAPIAILAQRPNGEIIFANDTVKQMLEADDVNRLIGTKTSKYIIKEDLPKIEDCLNEVLNSSQASDKIQHGFKSVKGNVKIARSQLIPYQYQGSPALIVVSTDITNIQRTNDKLRDSQALLQSFVDHAPAAVAMFDRKMNYINCSNKWINDWCLMPEKTKEYFIGKNHYDLFPDVTDEWKKAHKKSLKGEILHSDRDHFVNKSGEDVWLRWETRPWYTNSDKIGGIMLYSEIITDQVKTELALKESEQLNRKLVAHSPSAIVIQNLQQEIVFANPKAAHLIGEKDEHSLIGKSIFDFAIPQNTELIQERIKEMFKTGKPAPFIEQPFAHSDGSYRYGESTMIPFEFKNQPAILSVVIDVTEVKKMTQQLKENENQLRQIIDAVPHYIFAKDAKGNFILANKAFAELYNTTTEYIEKNNALPHKYAPSKEVESKFLSIDKKVLKENQPITTPIEIFTEASGTTKYLQTTKVPFTIDGNTDIAILGISADITDRVVFEEQLQKSEKRHKALLNNLPDLIFINSIDGIYLDYHALRENLLIGPEKFLGKNVSDLFPKEMADKFLAAFKKASSKKPIVVNYSLSTNGYDEYFEARVIKYGKDKVLSVIRNVTEQTEAKIALEESQQNLDFYFSKSQDGFYIMESSQPFDWNSEIDKDQTIRRVFEDMKVIKINKSMLKQYGATMKQMMGFKLSDFFKHDMEKGYETLKSLFDKGKQQSVTQERRLDGSLIWVEGDYVCLYNKEGKIRGLFGFQRDISERIKSEKDLRKITEDLIKTNNELQQFAYLTSHDLRAPVVNLASLLNFYNRDNPNDEGNAMIMDKIYESVRQLQSTLGDLVDIVALKKQDVEKHARVNFQQVMESIKKSISQQITESKAQLRLDFQTKTIKYPKTHLNSILQNLLTNSIKYRSPDRILRIDVSTYPAGDYTCLEISDNGLGIDMDKYGDKLFGIYQRFHDLPNSKGLGLYIVKSQVELMGGHIEVSSEVDKGTSFKVFLKPN